MSDAIVYCRLDYRTADDGQPVPLDLMELAESPVALVATLAIAAVEAIENITTHRERIDILDELAKIDGYYDRLAARRVELRLKLAELNEAARS